MNMMQAFNIVFSNKPVYLVSQCYYGSKKTAQSVIKFENKFKSYVEFVRAVNESKLSFRQSHKVKRSNKLLGVFIVGEQKIVFRFKSKLSKSVGVITYMPEPKLRGVA